MRAGNRRGKSTSRTSGTPPDAEDFKGAKKRTGSGGKFRPKTTGTGYKGRRTEGDGAEKRPFGSRPYAGRSTKPFGDRKKSYGSRDERPAGDKPRFSRDGAPDKPRFPRRGSDDKPRFSREGGADKPRFPRSGSDDKPRFSRDGGADKPRFSRKGSDDKPRFSRDGGSAKTGFSRTGPGDKPRFSRDRGADKAGFSRPGRDDKRGYSGNAGKPSGERSSRFKKPFEKFRRDDDRVEKPDAAGEEQSKWNRKEKHEFYGERKKRTRTFRKPEATPEPKEQDGTIRLNKYISNAGICSRREADELITAGVISVNGEVVTTLGYKVQPGDVVKYNDAKLKSEKPVYLLLNKPKDFITTVDDPQNRNTVMSLIRNACKERVYPVGRLDRNTTGLLLFTNDGDLADKLTHPSFEVQKVYEVHLDKNLKPEHFEEISKGVALEDGVIKPDEISYSSEAKSIVGIELHSGRNRIVRRIFEHFGYRVEKLDRVLYAGLTKKDLPRSKWRFLTDLELANLKMMTGNKRFKAAPKRISMAEE